jgi:ribosome-associated protein
MDDPMPLGRHAAIPLREVVVRASRSSGPGGQHANVTASRIEANFDVAASTALGDEQKQRIIARLGPRVTAVAQDSRSQTRNREIALERLQRRLTSALSVQRPRRPTKPSRAAAQRRLDAKRRRSERKQARRTPRTERD